jgi:hypothetical protein
VATSALGTSSFLTLSNISSKPCSAVAWEAEDETGGDMILMGLMMV